MFKLRCNPEKGEGEIAGTCMRGNEQLEKHGIKAKALSNYGESKDGMVSHGYCDFHGRAVKRAMRMKYKDSLKD